MDSDVVLPADVIVLEIIVSDSVCWNVGLNVLENVWEEVNEIEKVKVQK